ncbi:ABC transporter permease [Pseudogulbenkiania subflava]|uniref:ABC-2 type transport system permease protein n=1 Tax=Pseudogulbenkiania subflava DSM 22618 TaxID=1123014 RepID=A0A1Y6BF75_9NEIS|nr:ABC transporter permease [Pseudogulbenkiania subflava]SMF07851.1 ABC-2 type transport system permease protein [Pseudogulbenkiania subflava DSM 22618]
MRRLTLSLPSLQRWLGIVVKEFIQLKRDRLTFGMIIGIPIIQLLLFGFAINSDPKHLPTAVVMAEASPFARAYLAAMRNSDYFDLVGSVESEAEAARLLDRGDVQFVVTFPPGFQRALVRGEQPSLLVEADATDPVAAGSAISVLNHLGNEVFTPDLPGFHPPGKQLIELRLHKRYNPEGITAYNIVPGLMGVILTMTMVLMTGLAMTRERERGTFENLLATPATPLEVMTGKIVPYILIGLIQVSLVLLAARWVFDVPMLGSLVLLYAVVLLFICANLTLGITFSSIARNQLQAMQMTFFFFLPSILLSGFMFPFRGMPEWAQAIGNCLPLTHFLVLVRGILLKGNDVSLLWPQVWPILAFMAVVLGVGLKTFRRTLD